MMPAEVWWAASSLGELSARSLIGWGGVFLSCTLSVLLDFFLRLLLL